MSSQYYSDAMLRRKLEEMGVQVGPITDTTRAVYQRKLRQKQNEERASSTAKRPRPADPLEYGEPPAKKPRRPKPREMQELPTRTTTKVNVCPPLPRDESFSSHPPSPPNSKRKLEFLPNEGPSPQPPSPQSPSLQPPFPQSPSLQQREQSPSPQPPSTQSPSPQSPFWQGGLFSAMTGWIEAGVSGVKKIANQIQHAASPRPALRRNNDPSFRQHREKIPLAPPSPLRTDSGHDSVPVDQVDLGEEGLEIVIPSPPATPCHDTHYDWELLPSDVLICKQSNGALWKLGKGGFGEVFKGMKDGIDEVAVKVIKIQGSPLAIEQFKQEIDMISKLRHRHILQFYGACVKPSCLYMVTELMQTDLFTALKHDARYKWTGVFGRGITVGIAAGLHYLHSRRPPVVHRDIKSPNVLLMEGIAKIADVGIARTKAASDMTAQRGFTIAWAAPEVVYRKRATEKIDIWSFGIILWEIVTGRPPGPGHLELPLWAPGPLRVLYCRCVEEEPGKRPGAGELVQTLKDME